MFVYVRLGFTFFFSKNLFLSFLPNIFMFFSSTVTIFYFLKNTWKLDVIGRRWSYQKVTISWWNIWRLEINWNSLNCWVFVEVWWGRMNHWCLTESSEYWVHIKVIKAVLNYILLQYDSSLWKIQFKRVKKQHFLIQTKILELPNQNCYLLQSKKIIQNI